MPSPFLESLRRHMLVRRYSRRTVDSYLYWTRYYILFSAKRHPSEMGSREVEAFLTFLAVERNVSAATQSVALNALAFLYDQFLQRPLGELGQFRRASRQRKLPVVLTRDEIFRLLATLDGVHLLMASLLYGSGLQRIELVRLRVKDMDLDHLQVQVWYGKGAKHRLVTLAPELVEAITLQIERVRQLLREDSLKPGYDGVWMPEALARKYPSASKAIGW